MTISDGFPEERLPLDGPAPDSGHEVGTPIYDALYADYRGAFRSVPGERWGEDELRFRPFDRLELPASDMTDDEAQFPDSRAA